MSGAARPKGAALAPPGRPPRADDAVADGEGAHPYRASRSRLSIRSSVSAGGTGTLPWRSHAIAAANEPRIDATTRLRGGARAGEAWGGGAAAAPVRAPSVVTK